MLQAVKNDNLLHLDNLPDRRGKKNRAVPERENGASPKRESVMVARPPDPAGPTSRRE
ncbi:protein of unknown function [Cupriavidus neocaledonicus]|uniref:Uncharacterized protein n=1 Tax=Cupriavidus neocaledonicus TaxID=1040979 RepID=A0A375H5W8_9BURK|nr:hypothetical protein CBM2605_A170045 [Cupriavidus neocaledonicus]SPD47072.1 protein of unknown function [Cupriavidus neocaledonicus]